MSWIDCFDHLPVDISVVEISLGNFVDILFDDLVLINLLFDLLDLSVLESDLIWIIIRTVGVGVVVVLISIIVIVTIVVVIVILEVIWRNIFVVIVIVHLSW